MTYNPIEIQYRMQPSSKIEDGKVKLLPMSKLDAQDVLTDIVFHEIMHCQTAAEAKEIENKLKLIKEYTGLETVSYMGQVQATIQRLESKF